MQVEIDPFGLLEEKVENLIKATEILVQERDSFKHKTELQQERIQSLLKEIEEMQVTRDQAKQRIGALLQKIEELNL